jgi:hypothetical protein
MLTEGYDTPPLRRDAWLISGWMHTSASPRSRHSRWTCSHGGPVGSHATVTKGRD